MSRCRRCHPIAAWPAGPCPCPPYVGIQLATCLPACLTAPRHFEPQSRPGWQPAQPLQPALPRGAVRHNACGACPVWRPFAQTAQLPPRKKAGAVRLLLHHIAMSSALPHPAPSRPVPLHVQCVHARERQPWTPRLAEGIHPGEPLPPTMHTLTAHSSDAVRTSPATSKACPSQPRGPLPSRPSTHRSTGGGHDDACPVERVSAAGSLHAIQGQLGADQEDGQADERVQQAVPTRGQTGRGTAGWGGR